VQMIVGIVAAISATVLVIAGLLKIGSLSSFGKQIASYEIMPAGLATVSGYLIPPIEIGIGISLLFLPVIAAGAACLFMSFALAVGVNLLRGRSELRCGCFGPTGKHTISLTHVVGNVGLSLLAVWVAVDNGRPSFLAFQIGTSLVVLAVLAQAWRAMPRLPAMPRRPAEERKEAVAR
jgi:methylamine utilization protein MauE